MVRRVIAGLIAVGLGLGIWALWPRSDGVPDPTTTVLVADPATTTTLELTNTTPIRTRSTSVESHIVETVEEAEAILRELWFGWFEGIYNQDDERIREVVATEHQFELARAQFGVMEFTSVPRSDDIAFDQTEILRTDSECLVVWTTTAVSEFSTGETTDVHVLRWNGEHWGFFSLWVLKGDLWATDCAAQLDS